MGAEEDIATGQSARIRRIAGPGAAIAAHLALCWTLFAIGGMQLGPLELLGLSLLSAAGFLLLAVFIRAGWNLRLKDPALILPQTLWALTLVVVTSHFTPDYRGVALLSGLALVIAGAGRLSPRQQAVMAGCGLLLYTLSALYPVGGPEPVDVVLLLAWTLMLLIGPALHRYGSAPGRALQRALALAAHDELTGACNRRHLNAVLASARAKADGKQGTFSLCYIDLDNFKQVNDRFGHAAGDELLKHVAGLARNTIREVDCVARVGGDEFVLVLPGAGRGDAAGCAARLMGRLEGMTSGHPVTVSVGIAEYRPGDEPQQLLDRADRALCAAKRAGGNRIVQAAGAGYPAATSADTRSQI